MFGRLFENLEPFGANRLSEKPLLTTNHRWKKLPEGEFKKGESFLLAHEKFCVSACSGFLRIKAGIKANNTGYLPKENKGNVWYLPSCEGEIAALIVHNRRCLFPVFAGQNHIPNLRFLEKAYFLAKTPFSGKVPIHAIQGLRRDVELLESLMEKQGYLVSESIDYDLMILDGKQRPIALKPGPKGLVLRPPKPEDEDGLFALHSAYEQEEVLTKKSVFNPEASRLNLKHILSRESVLVAEMDGRLVAKINTNAESFNRVQIGGVYVHPHYRRKGIAAVMSMVFTQGLLENGKNLTLFVKKRNLAARKVYHNIGFDFLADFRINYY